MYKSVAKSYRVSNQRLTAATLVLFLLAADVVEGEEQVMSLCQTGRQSQLHLFVEVWRPARSDRSRAQRGGKKKRPQQDKTILQL